MALVGNAKHTHYVTDCEQRSTLKKNALNKTSSKRLPLPRGRHALPPPQRRPLVVPLHGRILLATVHFGSSGLPTLGPKRSRPKRGPVHSAPVHLGFRSLRTRRPKRGPVHFGLRWLPTRRPKSRAKIPLPQRSENSRLLLPRPLPRCHGVPHQAAPPPRLPLPRRSEYSRPRCLAAACLKTCKPIFAKCACLSRARRSRASVSGAWFGRGGLFSTWTYASAA